jgi:hypothetical protein
MPWNGYSRGSQELGDGDVFFQGRSHRTGCVEARGSLDGGRGQPPFYRRRLDGVLDGDWDYLLLAPTIADLHGGRPASVPGCLWFALVQSLVPRTIGGRPLESPLFPSTAADLRVQGTHVRPYFVDCIDSALTKLAQILRPVATRTHFSLNAPHVRLAASQQLPVPQHTAFSEPLLLVDAAAGQFTPPLPATSFSVDHAQLPSVQYGCMAWSTERLAAWVRLDPEGYKLLRIKDWPNTVRSSKRLMVLLLSSRSCPAYPGCATEWGAHVFVNWSMYGPAAAVAGVTPGPEMTIHLCHDVACLQPQHLIHGTKRSNAGAEARATANAQALLDVRRRGDGVAHWTRLRDAAAAVVQQWSAEAQVQRQRAEHAQAAAQNAHVTAGAHPGTPLSHLQLAVAQRMLTEAVAAAAARQDAMHRVQLGEEMVAAASTNIGRLH